MPALSISRRLSLGVWAVILGSLTLVVVPLVIRSQRTDERILREDLVTSADRLVSAIEPALWSLDLDHAEELGKAFRSDSRIVTIRIHEAVSGAVRVLGDSTAVDTMSVRRPVQHDGTVIGDVQLAFDRAVYRDRVQRDVQNVIIVALVVLLMSVVGVRLLVRSLLERPLADLSTLVARFAQGNYDPSPALARSGHGELRTLGDVLTTMGEQIRAQLQALTESNARLATEVRVREEAEAALRLQGAALQAAANAIAISTADSTVVWVNDAFTANTGYSAAEAIGRQARDLVRPRTFDPAVYEQLWSTVREGRVWQGEIQQRRKDESTYVADLTVTPLRDANGAITHLIAVEQDITDRLRLEAQVRQAQKMESVGRLAGGVAHDFNNMLSVIIGNTELALMHPAIDAEMRADLEQVRRAANRSADLTRQLLTFARKQDVRARAIDLNAAVEQSLTMLRRMIGEHVQFTWQPAVTVWPISIDPAQLDQVLANLCVNARDAIGDLGQVTITTANRTLDEAWCAQRPGARPGEFVMLSVSDTGCGMPPDVLSEIFEPFFTTKPIGEGTGLGLATVYGVVTQHNGFITVSSTVGVGSTFEMYWPRHAGAPASPTEAKLDDRRSHGETILVVEDEPMVLEFAVRALRTYGYAVLAAASANEAIALVHSHVGQIQLIVSDVVMPMMSGPELAGILNTVQPRAAVLYMSGFSRSSAGGHRLIGDGATYISKPFSPEQLATKVREVLDQRALRG
jgi:PAS domain S-box-containing protein